MKDSQMFGILVNSTVAGVYIYQGIESRIVFTNKCFTDMLGYENDELISKSLFDIYANSKEELQGYVNRRIQDKLSSDKHLNFSLISKNKALNLLCLLITTVICLLTTPYTINP